MYELDTTGLLLLDNIHVFTILNAGNDVFIKKNIRWPIKLVVTIRCQRVQVMLKQNGFLDG